MLELRVSRRIRIPDPLQLELYRRVPELGPRILFFSGGTALRDVSRQLVAYTHNSIHIMTPFDSGGSSAKLRKAFRMLAVGDLRNRLMALADRSVKAQKEIIRLFAFRFPKDESDKKLRRRLDRLAEGRDPMIRAVADPMRRLIRNHLGHFLNKMPKEFDLSGANIGNLILAGGYLNNDRHIDSVVFLFSKLVQVRGVVRPVSSENMHLAAELEDGETLVGQHLLTGREVPPLTSPVANLYLARRLKKPESEEVFVRKKIRKLIRSAHLICYPIGSFYTSLVANLLLKGIGDAIAEAGVPKIYIPNSSVDVEEIGMDLPLKVKTLIHYLHKSCEKPRRTDELISHVAVDTVNTGVKLDDIKKVRDLGVEVVDLPLATDRTAPLLDSKKLVETLVSLA